MENMSMGLIFAGIVFGSLGIGYFIYGKKQKNWVALCAGLALCVVPYFIAHLGLLLLVGAGLAAAPFIASRWL
jgi:hypothetical protein